MTPITSIDEVTLRTICDVLGDTNDGLTNADISNLLRSCGISDLVSASNKRSRIFEALVTRQQQDGCANNIIAFIQAASKPVRFVERRQDFESWRTRLNVVLAFVGMSVREDGHIAVVAASHTLSEAEQRASRLRRELQNRNVHPDVLRFCRAELLVDDAFGSGGAVPLLVFNRWSTNTEKDEHAGLMNLLKGLFGAFRNTTAHAPRIKWVIKEQDASDMLTLASLLHRRLDEAVKTR